MPCKLYRALSFLGEPPEAPSSIPCLWISLCLSCSPDQGGRGHHCPTPALPQASATVTASEQEVFYLLPATEALHRPTAQTGLLFAPSLKASGCDLHGCRPILPSTGLQSLSAGYLCILPIPPPPPNAKESGNLIKPLQLGT